MQNNVQMVGERNICELIEYDILQVVSYRIMVYRPYKYQTNDYSVRSV